MSTALHFKRSSPEAVGTARAVLVGPGIPSWSRAALLVIGGLTVAAHVLGAGPLRGLLWGSHFYGFLPPIAIVLSALSVLTVLAALHYGCWLARGPFGPQAPEKHLPSLERALAGLAVIGSLGLFWLFRAGHTLWGDGHPLTQDIPTGDRFHPLEPLTFLLQHYVYAVASPLFHSMRIDNEEVARNAIALGSALAGAAFMPVAWALAGSFSNGQRTLDDGRPASGAVAAVGTAAATVPLVFLVLIAQGYIQLFFGYVENYTFYTLALGLYFLGAHRFLAGRAPLILPAAALLLAMAFHLSAASMLPSFAALALTGLLARGRRSGTLRDLAISGALFAIASAAFSLLSPGYDLGRALVNVITSLGRDSVKVYGGYFGSSMHVRDFLNEQFLIGPLGSFLFLPISVASLLSPARRDPSVVFSLTAGAGYLAACLAAGDSNLGYARNWDLLAPAGFVFTAASLHLALRARWRREELRKWLLLAAALSLFHTVPWIAMNTSFDYSFDRLKSLSLGLGRTEATVGSWYYGARQDNEAVRWFERSLEAYPANNVAAYYLGQIAMEREDYLGAASRYSLALQARPTKELYRACLAEALIRAGQPERAKAQLDMLVRIDARDPRYWAGYGIVWTALGTADSARAAFRRAQELAPQDSSLAALSRRLNEPGDYQPALRELWPGLRR